MVRCATVLIAALLLTGAVGCASTEPGSQRYDFELYGEGQEIENMTIGPEIGSDVDVSAERDRVGARFAFGPPKSRGFVQIFRERWEFTDLPGGQPGARYDNHGIGGGVKGAPVVGKIRDQVTMLIPYRADLSFVWGEHEDDSEWEMRCFDLHLEAGFGIDWRGLRPSAGLAMSAVGGVMTGYGVETDFAGGNVGVFLDLAYKHPEFPLYAHVRAMGGDYRMLVLGFGAKF